MLICAQTAFGSNFRLDAPIILSGKEDVMSDGTKPWVVCLTCQSGFPLELVYDDSKDTLARWESPVLTGGEERVLEWMETHSDRPQHDIRWLPQSEALKALLPAHVIASEDDGKLRFTASGHAESSIFQDLGGVYCADDVRPAVLVPVADVLRSEPEVARDQGRSIINTNNLLAAWRSKP
jgi:hypothetical protein